MAEVNRQFLLAARPQGMVKESDFQYHEAPVPEPDDGQVLIRTRYISLDPSMRGQMENRADYVAPLEIGDVMRAGRSGSGLTGGFADTWKPTRGCLHNRLRRRGQAPGWRSD